MYFCYLGSPDYNNSKLRCSKTNTQQPRLFRIFINYGFENLYNSASLLVPAFTLLPLLNLHAARHLIDFQHPAIHTSEISNFQFRDSLLPALAECSSAASSSALPARLATQNKPVDPASHSYRLKGKLCGTPRYSYCQHKSSEPASVHKAGNAATPA